MTVHTYRPTGEEVAKQYEALVSRLRHDQATGVVWGPSGEPLMLIHAARVFEMLEVLESVLSYAPARGFVRQIGYRTGIDGARGMREVTKEEPTALLLSVSRALGMAGGGTSGTTYDDAAGTVTLAFPEGTAVGIAAARGSRRTNPACAYFEGLAAGWAKGSVDLDVEFDETACRSVGGGECRFESRPLR